MLRSMILAAAATSLSVGHTEAPATECPVGHFEVKPFFQTAAQCLEVSGEAFLHYYIGVVDGISLAPVFGGSEACYAERVGCVGPLPGSQGAAIAEKFIRAHPEFWDGPCAVSIMAALTEFCRSRRPAD